MKRDQLQKTISYHESALRRVKQILDERYEELEEKGEEMKWLREYQKQQTILNWLYAQIPDDN